MVLAVLLGVWAVAASVLAVVLARRQQSAVAAIGDAARRAADLTVEVRDTSARSAHLLRALDAIPQGVIIADETGEVVVRNKVAEQVAEARHGEALVQAAVEEQLAQAVAGVAGNHTVDLFSPPRRTLEITTTPLHADGRPTGALVVIDDISERRRADAVRRDFVANISHELKTPVAAMGLLAETLVGEDDPATSHRLAERILSEAFRLDGTIEDLLALSRIESADGLEEDDVDLADVVAVAVARVAPAAEQAGIDIRVEPGGIGLTLPGDRRQLASAVYNLLDNAIKYSDPGGAVTVSTSCVGDEVVVSVADHGIGIPSRDLERVFERFYRVDQARSRATGGTGLGLAIVRHVANNHHGTVSVESRTGEGSTFTLQLPRRTEASNHSNPGRPT